MTTHVILFNLGSVNGASSLKPFLRHLFMDPAILRLPYSARRIATEGLIWLRSFKKSPYAFINYHSPLLEETKKQQQSLQCCLPLCQIHIAMRCSKPFIEEIVEKIAKDTNLKKIILLPLYPHFSTTTTGSAFYAFDQAWKKYKKDPVEIHHILSYATHPLYLQALEEAIAPVYETACLHGDPLVVFSAHGLPLSIVEQGDPYLREIHSTAQHFKSHFDSVITFQSGCKKGWTMPSTQSVIKNETRPLVIVPLSFVSEHVETCVELDIIYKKEVKTSFYGRVPALGTSSSFIQCLKALVTGCL